MEKNIQQITEFSNHDDKSIDQQENIPSDSKVVEHCPMTEEEFERLFDQIMNSEEDLDIAIAKLVKLLSDQSQSSVIVDQDTKGYSIIDIYPSEMRISPIFETKEELRDFLMNQTTITQLFILQALSSKQKREQQMKNKLVWIIFKHFCKKPHYDKLLKKLLK